jgi:hypothetical protein
MLEVKRNYLLKYFHPEESNLGELYPDMYNTAIRLKDDIQTASSLYHIIDLMMLYCVDVHLENAVNDCFNSCEDEEAIAPRFVRLLLEDVNLLNYYLKKITSISVMSIQSWIIWEIFYEISRTPNRWFSSIEKLIHHPYLGRAIRFEISQQNREIVIQFIKSCKYKWKNDFIYYDHITNGYSFCDWEKKMEVDCQGLSRFEIELVPVITTEIHKECFICNELVSEFYKLPCSHLIHKECIENWYEKKKEKINCPLCRQSI